MSIKITFDINKPRIWADKLSMKVRGSVWIKLLVLIMLAIGGAYYTLLYTPMPLQLIAKAISQTGMEIEGVDGSLKNGITVARLKYSTPDVTLEIQGGKYQSSNFAEFYTTRRILIQSIEAQKVDLNIIKLAQYVTPALPTPSTAAPKDPESKDPVIPLFESESNPKGLKEFRIEQIKLQNTTFKTPKLPSPLEFKTLEIKNFVMTAKTTTLESMIADGNSINLKLKGLKTDPEQVSVDDKLSGTIKAEYLKDHLAKDMSFSLSGRWGKKEQVYEFKAFEDKFVFRSNPDQSLSAQFIEFTPSEHLKTQIPLQKCSVSLESKTKEALWTGPIPAQGNVVIGKTLFIMQTQGADAAPGTALATYTKDKNTLSLKFKPDLEHWKLWLSLTSTGKGTERELLTALIYGKTNATIPVAERAQFESGLTYFGSGPSPETAPQTQLATTPTPGSTPASGNPQQMPPPNNTVPSPQQTPVRLPASGHENTPQSTGQTAGQPTVQQGPTQPAVTPPAMTAPPAAIPNAPTTNVAPAPTQK